MADPNDNDKTETFETTEVSAGEPERPAALEALAIAAEAEEPTDDDFDARQAAMGEVRKSAGPPLPEGDAVEAPSFEAVGEVDEPTEVKPPRAQDQ